MAANPIIDFDLGPLTWVKTEIDHSLAQARDSLDKLAANAADRAPAKYILTHLHQATGALAMVGLGAATRFNEELEKLVAHLEHEDAAQLPAAVAVAKRGIAALSSYLDALLAGHADHPMRLLGPYLELNRARHVNDATEADLFHPNLSVELPGPVAPPLDDVVYAKSLSLQRSQYQQGLLRMLKGGDASDALRQMQGAMAAIESMQQGHATRAFWTAATALFDALVFGGLDISPTVKPLFAKLDQQVKQHMDGAGKVAERVFRDLLLAVGRARPVSERITLLKEAYRLDQLLATPDRNRGADDEALSTLVRELRELTAQQKDTWLKYTSGNRAALEPFGRQAVMLAERAARLPQPEAAAVLVRLTEVAPALKARAIPPSEAQALEVATALLFLESALENFFKLGRDFPRQAQAVTARLGAAMAGEALPPMGSVEGGLLDEMTRRAQEKLLVFQVGQEVQVNLQNIEQVLDGFFRDAARRADLPALTAQFAQVQGALMIMELADAAALNAAVMARVQQFADGSVEGTGSAADLVADGLSALGLYVTALQQGASSPRDVLMPALLRFGLVEAPKPGAESVVRRTGTVSPLDIDVQKQKVQALYVDWKDTPQQETREKLERAVDDLKRDAGVAADATVQRQSEEALQVLSSGMGPNSTGVFRLMEELAPEKSVDTPLPQTVQLVDAPGAEVDRELLEIFLEEAAEVVATIAESLRSPHDREALVTIRRGFHTLKGSGRMVGLNELGEMAWQCEQVMNKWLKDDRPMLPVLVSFIDLARGAFARWVAELQASGSAMIDGAEIVRRAEILKGDTPEAAQAIVPPAAIVAPAAPEIAPAAPEIAAPAAPESAPPEPAFEETPAPAEAEPALDIAAQAPALTASEEPPPVPFDFDVVAPADAAPGEAPPPVPTFAFESLDLAPTAPEERVEATPIDAPAVEEPAFDFESLFNAAPATPLEPVVPAPSEPTVPEEPTEAFVFESEPEGEPEVLIGDVAIPAALFAIYIGEAEQHVAVLDHEMSGIEENPLVPVSPAFMRAAHTLCSTSRTTALDAIARLASALEKWLADAIDLPPEFDAHRLGVTRRAVDALTAMVQSVRGQAAPYPRDELVPELESLREGLRESRRTGEGTHVKLPGYLREALAPPFPVQDHEATPIAPLPEDEGVALEPVAEVPAHEEPVVAQTPVVAEEPGVEPPAVQAIDVEPPAAEPPAIEQPAAEQPEPPRLEVVAGPVTFDELPPAAVEDKDAEVAGVFEAGKEQRRIVDDLDHDLLPIFIDEAKEIVPQVSESVRRWKAAPADHSPVPELQRQLHTLKGSARMTGLMRLGELAHSMESRVDELDRVASPETRAFEDLEERVDRFSLSLERLARGEDILEAEPIQVPAAAVFEHQKDKPAALAVIAAAVQERAEREAVPAELREGRQALLRVNADLVDRFVNEAGEMSIARSRIELEMATFKRSMVDLTENIARMRTQLREIEISAESQMQSTFKAKEDSGESFDPLEFDRFSRMQELTRFLAESLGDVITLHQGLQKNLDETELAIHAQARLNRELQQGLMGVRLVPLGNLADRFYRVVRQTAKELDKKANLEIKGTRTELDRSVLEKITGPFEHLLRNAIAHGIESPAARVAAGKPEIGEITLDAVQRGNEVVLTIGDDGAGLDFARIREKAVQAGLLGADAELPEAQLAQFIFTPGFSTASEVTQVAGRGVGMDVVKSEITALGGRVDIASTRGRGALFTITLPLTLAVTQAVMLRAGTTVYAIPSVMVDQVQEYKAAPYAEAVAKGEVAWKDNHYALRSLLPLLGEIDSPTPARQIPVLLLKSGTQRAAIRVDEIIGNREVVVKTIGPQLSRLMGIAGATVLGNGQVVLILNPVQLVHREQSLSQLAAAAHVPDASAELTVEQKSGAPLVLVVDDSLTVRKITGRMLTREGFEVASAKDGVDALQQLQDMRPDCILLDVEMPRMDGFEFARNVRADATTRDIPIIMITSRTADKHRNRAIELGVNEYMGKPYQEDQLLALIRRYTAEGALA